MTKNKYLSLFLILLITFIASAIGGYTTASYKEPWYSEIILPSYNPPSWVFGPVWTTLYVMMSVAIWKIWIKYFSTDLMQYRTPKKFVSITNLFCSIFISCSNFGSYVPLEKTHKSRSPKSLIIFLKISFISF